MSLTIISSTGEVETPATNASEKRNLVVDTHNVDAESANVRWDPTSATIGDVRYTDPIRLESGAVWRIIYEGTDLERLVFGLPGQSAEAGPATWVGSTGMGSTALQNVVVNTALTERYEETPPGPDALGGEDLEGLLSTPFRTSIREEVIIYGRPGAFSTSAQWESFCDSVFCSPYKWVDHANEYVLPITKRESFLQTNLQTMKIADINYDYNFYSEAYERRLKEAARSLGSLPETIYPHLYTIYLEMQRGFTSPYELGAPGGYDLASHYLYPEFEAPVDTMYRIEWGGGEWSSVYDTYDTNLLYSDFITLNKRIPNVFINILGERYRAPDLASARELRPEVIGEYQEGEYYFKWANHAPSLLDNGTEGLNIMADMYRNVIMPPTTLLSAQQQYNRYKELFPMFANIEIPQLNGDPSRAGERTIQESLKVGTPPSSTSPTSAGTGQPPLVNGLIQQVMADLANFSDTSDPRFTATYPSIYTQKGSFTEEHTRVSESGMSTTLMESSVFVDKERRIFDFTDWIENYATYASPDLPSTLGFTGVLPSVEKFVFLKNFPEDPLGSEVETDISHDCIIENPVEAAASMSEFLDFARTIVHSRLRTYEQLLGGSTAYSEDIFYRLTKYRLDEEGNRVEVVQNCFFPNMTPIIKKLRLVDTQFRYNTEYDYEIYTYRLVVGSSTRHIGSSGMSMRWYGAYEGAPLDAAGLPTSLASATPYLEGDWTPVCALEEGPPSAPDWIEFTDPGVSPTPWVAKVVTETVPSVKLIELPYLAEFSLDETFGRGAMLDDPGVSPSITVVPYRGVNSRLLFLIEGGIGEMERHPLVFSAEEGRYIDRLRNMIPDPNETKILYENDDPPVEFVVYRMEKKPESYKDFTRSSSRITTVFTETDATKYRRLPTTSFVDNIEPNVKYYYMVRSRDVHGHMSYPSGIYEIELVDDDGAVYPLVRTIRLPGLEDAQLDSKPLKRFLQIAPQPTQTAFNEGETFGPVLNLVDSGEIANPLPTSAPRASSVSLGVRSDGLWGKKFKIRLTSRKSGKKIDLNINFTKEYIDDRPAIDLGTPVDLLAGSTSGGSGGGSGGGSTY